MERLELMEKEKRLKRRLRILARCFQLAAGLSGGILVLFGGILLEARSAVGWLLLLGGIALLLECCKLRQQSRELSGYLDRITGPEESR